jgi:hypothetical protein
MRTMIERAASRLMVKRRRPLRPFCSRKQDTLPTNQEDHQARFYEDYRKVAEEYDKDFLKKYDEDLNTTLIFVSST